MAFTEDELKTLSTLLGQEVDRRLEKHLSPFRREVDRFRQEVDQRFSEVLGHIDGLAKANETREHEYLVVTKQLDDINTELANHRQYFDDLGERVTVLEKKIA